MQETFETWLRALDAAVETNIGLSTRDLPDMPYRAWFESGMTVEDAVTAASVDALAENGFTPGEIEAEYGLTFETIFG